MVRCRISGPIPGCAGKNSLSRALCLWKASRSHHREVNALQVSSPYRFGARLVVSFAAMLVIAACGRQEAPRESTPPQAQSDTSAPATSGAYRVYVTNERSGDLTVIDGETHQVLSTVPLGKRPRGIQVSPDGTQLFVALSGSPIAGPGVDASKLPPADPSADGIGVIDIASLKLLRILRGVSDPEQMVVTPDGKHLYIASEDTGTAVIVDVESGSILGSQQVGGEPEGVGISPDGRFVYMTSEEHHQVSVLSTESRSVVKQFSVGERPRQAAFSSDGKRAYVTGEMDGSVSVIDATAHEVIHTIKLSGDLVRPMEVDLSPDDRLVYVTTGRGRTLVAIDAATNEPVKQVTVGMRPWGLAVSPDGKKLFTANGPSDDVSVVDAESFQVIATVPVGTSPWGVVIVEAANSRR